MKAMSTERCVFRIEFEGEQRLLSLSRSTACVPIFRVDI